MSEAVITAKALPLLLILQDIVGRREQKSVSECKHIHELRLMSVDVS